MYRRQNGERVAENKDGQSDNMCVTSPHVGRRHQASLRQASKIMSLALAATSEGGVTALICLSGVGVESGIGDNNNGAGSNIMMCAAILSFEQTQLGSHHQ
jgi:hypothetical protein